MSINTEISFLSILLAEIKSMILSGVDKGIGKVALSYTSFKSVICFFFGKQFGKVTNT